MSRFMLAGDVPSPPEIAGVARYFLPYHAMLAAEVEG